MLAYADKMVGNIVKKLKEEGLSENTLIIFTGDNGTDKPVVSMMGSRQVPGGKGSMDDSGNHVPLVVSWPGTINKGGETNTLVDFSDMLPTICAAAGISVPAELNIDGRSFLPQLKGDFSNEREWIYVWYSRNGLNKDTKVFVRNQRYKLYDDGKFFDVEKDIWEKTPLMENSLSTEQQKLKDEFQQVLLSKKRVK
ncbi:MAG: sulfatase-like hydrolase/transferase [Lentisphaeraceae bacterium]|nr:sulfatase-like hydrolase/transferase [Lentisphaeraceae bacterium]